MARIDVPFVVEKQRITQPTREHLVAGGQNYFYATFKICDKWCDIPNLKAVFVREEVSKLISLVKTEEGYECVIPWEVMCNKGSFRVGIFGGERLITDMTYVIVKEGCVTEGDAPLPPTPDWFSEIEEKLNDIGDGGQGGDGKSAYEIALEHGFEGSEEEWLESLKGEPGKDGVDGVVGKDGISTTHSWDGTILTITSASGASSANLKGDKGEKGNQGEKGDSYVITEADKAEIGSSVSAEIEAELNAALLEIKAIQSELLIPSGDGVKY